MHLFLFVILKQSALVLCLHHGSTSLSLRTILRTLSILAFTLTLLCGACLAQAGQPISGVVTNKTTNKPAAGDDVVLLKLAQGMEELSRTKTDARGKFTIDVPEAGLHLLRVTHDKANYFRPVQPGTQSVEIEVYSAAPQVDGVTLAQDVMTVQTDPAGSTLRVVEHFLVRNESSPAKTLFNEHPFEFYLADGAKVEGSTAQAPGGMGVATPLVPTGEPNRYTMIFPIRPGETEFNVWYQIPYSGKLTLAPRPVLPIGEFGIEIPATMQFEQGQSTPYQAVTEELPGHAKAYVAGNVQPSQPMQFTLTGKGELPKKSPVDPSGAPTGAGTTAGNQSNDPNADTRPGGGLGVPLDKDAERAPLTKYKWWILGGLGLVMAVAAGFLLREPSSPAVVAGTPAVPSGTPATPSSPSSPSSPSIHPLQALRDELFSLETDRLEGRLSDAQYAELKGAYDMVLRRALERQNERQNERLGTVAVAPE